MLTEARCVRRQYVLAMWSWGLNLGIKKIKYKILYTSMSIFATGGLEQAPSTAENLGNRLDEIAAKKDKYQLAGDAASIFESLSQQEKHELYGLYLGMNDDIKEFSYFYSEDYGRGIWGFSREEGKEYISTLILFLSVYKSIRKAYDREVVRWEIETECIGLDGAEIVPTTESIAMAKMQSRIDNIGLLVIPLLISSFT